MRSNILKICFLIFGLVFLNLYTYNKIIVFWGEAPEELLRASLEDVSTIDSVSAGSVLLNRNFGIKSSENTGHLSINRDSSQNSESRSIFYAEKVRFDSYTRLAIGNIYRATLLDSKEIGNVTVAEMPPYANSSLPKDNLRKPAEVYLGHAKPQNLPSALFRQKEYNTERLLWSHLAPDISPRPQLRPKLEFAQEENRTEESLNNAKVERALGVDHYQQNVIFNNLQEKNLTKTGKIVGIFETISDNWALLEDTNGNINILREGSRVGSFFVRSISNGIITLEHNMRIVTLATGDKM